MIHPCKCRHGDAWLEDPTTPLKRRSGGSGYALVRIGIADRAGFPVKYCMSCGGHFEHRDAPPDDSGKTCACIQQTSDDPAVPVEWDPKLKEFNDTNWTHAVQSSFRIYFCPWCGTKLPEGLRSKLHTGMDPAELASIRARLEGSNIIADVISRLGEPDRSIPGWNQTSIHGRLHKAKNVLRQLDYLHLGATGRVWVQEYEDGGIGWGFGGQPTKFTS